MDAELTAAGLTRQRFARKLTTKHLLERYSVCDRTLDRWIANPALNFPRPIVINRRRYWSEDEVDAFDAARKAAAV
jgi:predicted DNA-binding transcriptional regulator AlpA